MKPKKCIQCGVEFLPSYNVTKAYWLKRQFCSHPCSVEATKGIRRPTFGRPLKTMEERFWSKVIKGDIDECWLWKGAKDPCGYGKLGCTRRMGEIKAHRLAYQLLVGEITAGHEVCHKCDTPACVNPVHLFLGTHAENMADASAKKRFPSRKGEANPRSKLTKENVEEIRRLRKNGLSQQKIADIFGVTQVNISAILSGKVWKEEIEI